MALPATAMITPILLVHFSRAIKENSNDSTFKRKKEKGSNDSTFKRFNVRNLFLRMYHARRKKATDGPGKSR